MIDVSLFYCSFKLRFFAIVFGINVVKKWRWLKKAMNYIEKVAKPLIKK